MSGPGVEPRRSAPDSTSRRLWAWPPLRAALVALGTLVTLSYLVAGVAAGRLAPTERAVTELLLTPPGALGMLVLVVVVFAGPLAAVLAGALAANPLGTGHGRAGAADTDSTASFLRLFVSLAGLLVVGIGLAWACGLVSLLLAAWLAGSSRGPVDPAAVASLPAQLAVGAWAVIVAAALGYAAGALTGRRLAGLAAVGGILAVELVVGIADSESPLLAITPISQIGALATDGAAGRAAPALAVASAAAIGLVGVATASRRRAPPRPAGPASVIRAGATRQRGDGPG